MPKTPQFPESNLLNPGEVELIRRIRRKAARSKHSGLTLGIGDDCAILRPSAREDFAVTTDLSIAGRHFRLDLHPPEVVGHRTLARGLSDLAAMGAKPVAVFVSLGLPRDLTGRRAPGSAWVDRFYNGLLALADDYKTPLAGGDLAESPLPLADIALVGAVRRGKALLRSGARVGDELYVTGSLGGAEVAFEHLQRLVQPPGHGWARTVSNKMSDLLAPHLYPQPRIVQGQWLQSRGVASAAIDLSDGLSTDLTHLCEESGVGAEVDAAALPLHPKASLDHALHGGEDYELLFTAPRSARVPREIAGVRVTRIGRMVPRRPRSAAILLRTAGSVVALAPKGWQHFS